MTITGVDAVLFGVEDVEAAERFLNDWGVSPMGMQDGFVRFQTRDGTQVDVARLDDPRLPPAMQEGSTLRQVIWGVEKAADLDALAERLGDDAVRTEDGLTIADPNGLSHAFRVSRRVPVVADPQDVNGPGLARRVDARSQIYERAVPISVGHVVLFVDDLDASLSFFLDRLGFVVSDSYPGHAAFLRARTPGSHHDAFILRRPGNPGLNHVAFTVSNIHEVFGGGLAMSRKGWETDIGPGRHPISSAYFWYFKSPFGASLEYYADDDYCTEAWEPREYERRPELFAEWAIAGGIDGNSRRQARAA
ncbi:VOC family protein [Sphingobium sp.]|uniref:VOC family protein n=1 Tax=Sphingobium sp. TaxID=1912891 RepID=UPI0035C698CE